MWHILGEGGRKSAYRVLVGKPEGNRQFGRERLWWEDDTRIDQEIGFGSELDLAGDRDS